MIEKKQSSLGFESNISESFIADLLDQAKADGIEKIVGGAVVVRGGKVLLLTRTDDEFMPGLVELPSGNIDADEELIEGLIREVKEETGLDVTSVDDYVDSFDYQSGSGKRARQFNFLVGISDGEVTLNSEEHKAFNWITPSDLASSQANVSDHSRNSLQRALTKIDEK